MPENFIEKLAGVVIGIIAWAAFIPVIYELTILAAENAPEAMRVTYYLIFGAYASIPFDVIIAYILHSLR